MALPGSPVVHEFAPELLHRLVGARELLHEGTEVATAQPATRGSCHGTARVVMALQLPGVMPRLMKGGKMVVYSSGSKDLT